MAHAQAVQGLEMGHQAQTLCQGTSMLCMLIKLRGPVAPLSCHAGRGCCACMCVELTWLLSCCAGADPTRSSQPPGSASLPARASAGVGGAERDVQDTPGGGAGGQDLQPARELADTEAVHEQLLLHESGLNSGKLLPACHLQPALDAGLGGLCPDWSCERAAAVLQGVQVCRRGARGAHAPACPAGLHPRAG